MTTSAAAPHSSPLVATADAIVRLVCTEQRASALEHRRRELHRPQEARHRLHNPDPGSLPVGVFPIRHQEGGR